MEQFEIQLTISISGDIKRLTGNELFAFKSNANVLFCKKSNNSVMLSICWKYELMISNEINLI